VFFIQFEAQLNALIEERKEEGQYINNVLKNIKFKIISIAI